MYILIDERAEVTKAYGASFEREGLASIGFSPLEFEEWFSALPEADTQSIDCFIIGNCDSYLRCCQGIRQRSDAPTLALSEHRDLDCTLQMFSAGIDDVVRKPVHVKEIKARADAIWRRINRASGSVSLHGVKIYADGRDIEVDGVAFPLPRRERNILEYLVKNAHRRVTKLQIFNAVYGLFEEEVDDVVIEGHVSKLRKKLRMRTGREVIDAKRYLGYQFTGCRAYDAAGPASDASAAPAPVKRAVLVTA